MLKNKLLQKDNNIVRVLEIENSKALIVNCIKRSVPQWMNTAELTEYAECSINDLSEITGVCPRPIDELDNESRCIAYKRFTAIAGVLPYIADDKSRCHAISNMAQLFNISTDVGELEEHLVPALLKLYLLRGTGGEVFVKQVHLGVDTLSAVSPYGGHHFLVVDKEARAFAVPASGIGCLVVFRASVILQFDERAHGLCLG